MHNCTISVIIPTYGEPSFLRESIESVIRQSYQDWELIIIDDNNPETDARKATEQIVSSYLETDSRIHYIKHDKNKNGAVARNTGFAVAKGQYISLLDSDDEYLPERLQRCYDVMEKASVGVAGVYTGCEFRKAGKVYHVKENVQSGNFLVETLACRFMFCTGSNIFVRKSVIDELDGFDPTFLRHQDYEFLVRVFEKYSIVGIPEVLVVKNNENVNVPSAEKMVGIKKQYLGKFAMLIEKLTGDEKKYVYQSNYIGIAETAMGQKSYSLANEYYLKARQYGGLSFRTWMRRFAFPIYNRIRK